MWYNDINMKRLIGITTLLIFFLVNLSLTSFRSEALAFSVGEERQVGEKLLSIVRRDLKLLDDPDITQYVTRLGREVLKTAGPQFFDYHFFVVNNKEFNAFAAPSGLIFLHSGLIEVMGKEGEMVGVLAHEAGHVVSRHIADRLRKSKQVSIGTMALIIAGMAIGAGPISEALITGSMAAGASMSLNFSRQDEEEADRLAFKWMQAQGRDPAFMLDMLRTMRKVNLFRSGNIPPYLLTHPEPGARMGYVQDLLLFNETKEYPETDEFEFLRMKYRVLSMSKDPQVLAPQLRRILDNDKVNDIEKTMAHYGLAQTYIAQAQYAQAESSMKKVLTKLNNRPILKTDMGALLYESGRYKEALALFQKARKEDPDCWYTSYNLAKALQQMGKISQALRLYEELLDKLPDYSKLYFQISKIKAGQGEKASGYYYLGVYYWYEGNQNRAKYNLKKAQDELPEGNIIKEKAKVMLEKIEELEKI